ncbi:MAG: nonstructural protein [Microvirus sp.]|nr:MAG: nonstructural protein [Microvirus sp.]
MTRIMMSLFDKKAGSYGQPFFVVSNGAAFRSIGDELRRGGDDNVLAKHPSDFELYVVGSFDDVTAELKAEKSFLCNVESLKE